MSPIRRIVSRNVSNIKGTESGHSSDEEANLVVIENPDGSLLEGMPSGFKHATPIPSLPHTPRTLNFAATGIDLLGLFHRHERIFLFLVLMTVFIDAILLTEELAIVVGGIIGMNKHGAIQWGASLGSVVPFMGQDLSPKAGLVESPVRQTFTVFPPTWPFSSALIVASLDLFVCLVFFVTGFMAYVSKQRRSYTWFGTFACGSLIWQVILSCVDKLSLVLFLCRLACFTHARFMGDLMDDISLLASLIGSRVGVTERTSVRQAAENVLVYNSTS